jgi:uncharacterized protein (DUF4415 family)
MYNDIAMAHTTKRKKAKPVKSPGKKLKGQKVASTKARSSRGNWVVGMEKLYKPIKKPVTLRLDADVIAWYQTGGRGYQTRINRALRQLMLKEQKA